MTVHLVFVKGPCKQQGSYIVANGEREAVLVMMVLGM